MYIIQEIEKKKTLIFFNTVFIAFRDISGHISIERYVHCQHSALRIGLVRWDPTPTLGAQYIHLF